MRPILLYYIDNTYAPRYTIDKPINDEIQYKNEYRFSIAFKYWRIEIPIFVQSRLDFDEFVGKINAIFNIIVHFDFAKIMHEISRFLYLF